MNYRNSTNVVSHTRDTVPSNKESIGMSVGRIAEVEIRTALSHRHGERMAGRFLKGPISMQDISDASRLGGRALAVYLAIHHQTALTRKAVVTIPKGLLADMGIDKDAKARALQLLEVQGLFEPSA